MPPLHQTWVELIAKTVPERDNSTPNNLYRPQFHGDDLLMMLSHFSVRIIVFCWILKDGEYFRMIT
jgi:hypothetical protein